MDLESFERIHDAFVEFHAAFAPTFGRKQWRARSQDYLQALLVQAHERRNAENLSEMVCASARVLQRFLTEARWDDAAVTAHLQQYLGERLAHPEAVWVVDESGIVKQGKHSVGVARQYCGAVGGVTNCQVGVFLAHVSPRGRLLVDKRLYLPHAWTDDAERCEASGVPIAARPYQSKPALALELLQRARSLGHLQAMWVTGDDHYGLSPEFRDGVAANGCYYVLDVPAHLPVWPVEPRWETTPSSGRGRRPHPHVVAGQRQNVQARAARLPAHAWQELTIAQGAQGPRTYRFARERVRESRARKPGLECWILYRENLDGTQARYAISNAPEGTSLETLARVGATRWPIETEFQLQKSQLGLGDYEVRSWQGWNHHITMCLLAGAFLLTLQQAWGEKDAAGDAASGVSHGARVVAAAPLERGRAVAMAAPDAGAQ